MSKIKKGTSIIEVVIAATLISISIIAALSLANQSQKQNDYAKQLAEATKYASQVADWIRNERDRVGYATLYTLDDGIYCLNDIPAEYISMEEGSCNQNSYIPNTLFRREVSLSKTLDSLNIVITIYWLESVERQAKIELELTSWH